MLGGRGEGWGPYLRLHPLLSLEKEHRRGVGGGGREREREREKAVTTEAKAARRTRGSEMQKHQEAEALGPGLAPHGVGSDPRPRFSKTHLWSRGHSHLCHCQEGQEMKLLI